MNNKYLRYFALLISIMPIIVLIVSLAIFPLMILTSCSSNPNKAEKINTKMDNATEIAGEKFGTKDGKIIVQKKTLLAEELRRLQYEVYELEDQIYGNIKYGSQGFYGVLKDCKLKVSDKSLGGDGKIRWTEPMDRVTEKEEEFNFGIDENNKLVVVSEEYISDRIKRFQGYKKILRTRYTEYQEKIDICKAEQRSKEFEKQESTKLNHALKQD